MRAWCTYRWGVSVCACINKSIYCAPFSRQLQCRLNERYTRHTRKYAGIQTRCTDLHGAGGGARSFVAWGVMWHTPSTNKQEPTHTHMHTVASWSNDSWSTQQGRGLGREDA